MDLSDMQFAPHLEDLDPADQPLEPDLLRWRENVLWADHLLIVHPYWWGAMPSRAKTVLDRALTSGFGYKYHARGMGWEKLLAGRSADAVITSDTPPLLDTLLYRKPGRRVLKNQILAFCGIKPRKVVQFGSVKLASPGKIEGWIGKAEGMGLKAAA